MSEQDPKGARRVRTLGLVAVVVAVLAAAGVATAAEPLGHNTELFGGRNGGPGNDQGPPLPTPIKHVFLIVMENEQTSVIYGQQPYETQLANEYAWGGNANSPSGIGYYAVCHPSAPDYLALTSGLPLQCGSDAYSTYSVNNLGNLLDTASESWTAWEESASVACQTTTGGPAAGPYVVKHDPFPYFADLEPGVAGGPCETHVLPIANLTADFPYSQTPPAFTYIAPNETDDGHNSGPAVADHWLSTFIPKLIAQPWFQSSVIFITYDEAYETPGGSENFTGYDGLVGGPVYTVAVSPYTLGVGPLTYNSSHYDLLTTMEWLLGLPGTGTGNDSTVEFPMLPGVFQHRLFGPGVSLQYTDLLGANLSRFDLAWDGLQYADLASTDLRGADLVGANLQYANLARADLVGADLRGADLQYADLAGADLQGADLAGASLQYANLAGATLTGLSATQPTVFDWASLDFAVLTNAICGTPNNIDAFAANVNAVNVPAACVPPL